MGRPANAFSRSMGNLGQWIDDRLGVSAIWAYVMTGYYAPKNFDFWYFFGSLALLVLVSQLITGIWLAMYFKPDADLAFASVEFIMRDVEWGWLIRYMHSTGASAFFVVVYLHMFRGLLYGSYQKPRELLWVIGMLVFVALMAEAFLGYVLPWGQMSYWGAQVIISLFGAIPWVGDDLALWIRGDYVLSDVTLNRFFALHVAAMPLALIGLIFLHLMALRKVGSNNPDGIEIKELTDAEGIPLDGIPFHPYYTVKDVFGVGVFLLVAAFIVFFAPDLGGQFLEDANFEPADPLNTPDHIKPVWYFTPFYAILRAIPLKAPGVMLMGLSLVMLFLVPWLDRHPVRSMRYRGWVSKLALAAFVVSFIGLGYVGGAAGSSTLTTVARVLTVVYFGYFLGLPFYYKCEKSHPVPERVTKHG